MKIKRLDLCGFKSFVDKTTLHFPKGITAIVGPNGCGKSNIVDAIRWVLGEHNARQLRGQQMEDVIFNGSEQRKPVGMAEVVLTISNEGGSVPAAYSEYPEIEIMRRLFRSGESEYYLNRIPCRMKDIIDIFTDTGVGTRGYSIIEQGKIDWLVNARPGERRLIFEEAAGIHKYKRRKDAALKRLESTRQNLERVNDIISEVGRQLAVLDRHARKAKRYRELREEFELLELFFAFEEYSQFKSVMSDSLRHLEHLTDSKVGCETRISEREVSLELKRLEYCKAEESLNKARQEESDLLVLINTRERETELASARIEELDRLHARLCSETKDIESRKSETEITIKKTEGDICELGATISKNKNKLIDLEERLRVLTGKMEIQTEELERSRAVIRGNMTQLSQIRGRFQQIKIRRDTLMLETGRMEREREELLNNRGIKRENLSTMQMDMEEKVVLLADITALIAESSAIIQNLESGLSAKDTLLRGLKDELSGKSARLATLRELRENSGGVMNGMRHLMEMFSSGERKETQPKGIKGVLADFIRNEERYDSAIEAVLGDKLQYLVVPNHRDGLEAVNYLKSKRFGKGAFIAMRDSGASMVGIEMHAGKSEKEEDLAVERLIDHVLVEEGFSDIIKRLLTGIFLVSDLEDAVRIVEKKNLPGSFVTLGGELVSIDGVIIGGGSSDGGVAAGALSRSREIRELMTSVARLNKKVDKESNEREELSGKLNAIRVRKGELDSKAHGFEIEKVDLEARKMNESNELRHIEQRLALINSWIGERRGELNNISKEKESILGTIDELESENLKVELRSANFEKKIKEISGTKKELDKALMELRILMASHRERIDAMKRSLSSLNINISDMERGINDRSKEIVSIGSESGQLREDRKRLRDQLESLLRDKDLIKKGTILKRERLDDISRNISEAEDSMQKLRREIAKLDDERGNMDLKTKELDLKIGHIRNNMLEKYNEDIMAYKPAPGILGKDRCLLQEKYDKIKSRIYEFSDVNLSSIDEHKALEERHNFLLEQREDLKHSIGSLTRAINRINRMSHSRFTDVFDAINIKFKEVFPRFFNGGRAELRILDNPDIFDAGIDVVVQPPGKKFQNMSLLSGGEKALSAASLIFSIFMIKPSPFCLLDEVDAPLDDVNTNRFDSLLKEMSERSQFILITHNKNSMESADTLFGVTMEEPGISRIVSVELN